MMSTATSAAAAPAPATSSAAAPVSLSVDGVDVEVKPHKKPTQATKYKVLCCGNSALDLVLIPLSLIFSYVLTAILFALCMRAVLQTDDTATALWMFFGIFVAFVTMLCIVLGVTAYEKAQHNKYSVDAAESA